MTDIYEQHAAAFSKVSAFIIWIVRASVSQPSPSNTRTTALAASMPMCTC